MLVVRLVILAILLYIAWLLVRGITGRSGTGHQEKGAEKKAPSQDVLVEDPVCHTLVPKHQAVRLRRDGETFYFCSDACCDKFSETERGEK